MEMFRFKGDLTLRTAIDRNWKISSRNLAQMRRPCRKLVLRREATGAGRP